MAKTSSTPRGPRAFIALGLLALLATTPGFGQEAKKPGLFGPWMATAELSYVVTGGNTATSALSFGTSFTRKWTNDTLLFKSYVMKSNATTTTRTARGTETDFDVLEQSITRKVAENYLLAGQYDRRISKKLLGQAGVGWDRNRFAGIDDRLLATLGFGYAWVEKIPDPGQDLGGHDLHPAPVRRVGLGVLRRHALQRHRGAEALRELVVLVHIRPRRQPQGHARLAFRLGQLGHRHAVQIPGAQDQPADALYPPAGPPGDAAIRSHRRPDGPDGVRASQEARHVPDDFYRHQLLTVRRDKRRDQVFADGRLIARTRRPGPFLRRPGPFFFRRPGPFFWI
ncbi:MAG: DUF481 domain-containing protein [Candidatus Moduliflexus flocculans]|nr:DUF481 domain-containing protein [Candidatus Moduliflexus flocculans]